MLRKYTVSSMAVGLVLSTIALPAAGQEVPEESFLACPDGAPDAGFDDVDDDNRHRGAIDCGASLGIIEGRSETTFAPARDVNRGQLASLIVRTLEEAGIDVPPLDGSPNFPDLDLTHGDNVRRLAAAGVVTGFDDGTFRPTRAVSRQQMASMYARALTFARGGFPLSTEGAPTYTDVEEGVHFANIAAASVAGLLQGREDGSFRPTAPTRRDQSASVTLRFLDRLIEDDAAFQLTVLHINDGESMLLPDEDAGFPGAARFVADLKQAQTTAAAGDERGVVTISAGDNFLAGPRLNASIDDEDGRFFDALVYTEGGFDAMTIGNHEFDFGPDFLADFITATEDIPFISANLDVSGEESLAELEDDGRISASTTVETAGRIVGIVGATTELIDNISSPGEVVATDVQEAVQDEVDALLADEVDVVLLSSHLQALTNELELVPALSGVDAVIGGGGGEALGDDYPLTEIDADGDTVPVVTVPGNYTDIGQLELGFDDEGELFRIGQGSALVPVPMVGARDQVIAEQVEEPVAEYVAELENNVIAETEEPLDGRRDSVRTRETNLGNILVDSMVVATRDAGFDTDVAVQNGGGIRNDGIIQPGDITELDTFDVAAFSNFVSAGDVTGAELAGALEHSVSFQPAAAGSNGQWSGVRFTFDAGEPVGDRIVDAIVTRADASEVVLVEDGELVGGDEEFTIASIDFLLDGGDGYFGGEGIEFERLPGVTYQQSLAGYLADLGTVDGTNYPDLTVEADDYTRYGPVGSFTVD
jgi:2',3'-cyclic-nucleotide 2'-phosphodiesterase (5'-nucleotidase family)